MIGSSKNIKEAILDVCKNGKFVFIDAKIYQLYKRNTASFKDTTVVLFNSEDGLSIENEKGMFIHIPDAFPIRPIGIAKKNMRSSGVRIPPVLIIQSIGRINLKRKNVAGYGCY